MLLCRCPLSCQSRHWASTLQGRTEKDWLALIGVHAHRLKKTLRPLLRQQQAQTGSEHPAAVQVPPELPEPALGINFARDGMTKKDWLALVAVHSDTWLLAVAFYNGARLNKEGRCGSVGVLCLAVTSKLLWLQALKTHSSCPQLVLSCISRQDSCAAQ